MFHLAAYSASTTNNVETDLTPVPDDILNIQNGHFFPQTPMNMLFATTMSASIATSRIVTPTLRQVTTPFLRPVNAFAVGGSLQYVDTYLRNPMFLQGLEEIQNLTLQTGAGAEQTTTLIGLAPQQVVPGPSGPMYRMRGVGTATVVANAWSTTPIAWNDILPAGRYSVVGMEAMSATGQAARLILNGQYWRPGCMATLAPGDTSDPLFRNGQLGEWGQFLQTAMPQIQFLCDAADTAQEVYLDIVRIG